MNDIEFAALLVSRVCHDLVSPVSAVGNGLEVLADERDAGMRADALKLYKRIVDDYENEAPANAARLGLIAPYRGPITRQFPIPKSQIPHDDHLEFGIGDWELSSRGDTSV